jgi:hypothetical protein
MTEFEGEQFLPAEPETRLPKTAEPKASQVRATGPETRLPNRAEAEKLLPKTAKPIAPPASAAATAETRQLQAGDALGDLVLERPLGEGGAGEVWEARNQFTGQTLAVKICLEAGPRAQLANEARALGRLMAAGRSRNFPSSIVRLLETHLAHNPPYLVMEYVGGGDLRQRLRERGGRLDEDEVVSILRETLGALDFAHRLGMTHRDIKPENILLDRNGRAKVSDFGLGRSTTGSLISIQRSLDTAEAAADIGGTLDYMAPEQTRAGESLPASDIYSLGIVLFEMLTGERPRGFTKPSRRRPEIDPAWDAIFERCYAHDPADRFQTAAEFLRSLQERFGGGVRRESLAQADSPAEEIEKTEEKIGFLAFPAVESDEQPQEEKRPFEIASPQRRAWERKANRGRRCGSDAERVQHLSVELTAEEKLAHYGGYRLFGWVLPAMIWTYVGYFASFGTAAAWAPPLSRQAALAGFVGVALFGWIYSALLFGAFAKWRTIRSPFARTMIALMTLCGSVLAFPAIIYLMMYAGAGSTLLALGLHALFLGDVRAKLTGRRGMFRRRRRVAA